MLKPDPDKKLKGNDRYEGYCADLAREIAENVGFDYLVQQHGTVRATAPSSETGDAPWGWRCPVSGRSLHQNSREGD